VPLTTRSTGEAIEAESRLKPLLEAAIRPAQARANRVRASLAMADQAGRPRQLPIAVPKPVPAPSTATGAS